MTDEQQPVVHDPQAPVNMVAQASAQSAAQPASLSSGQAAPPAPPVAGDSLNVPLMVPTVGESTSRDERKGTFPFASKPVVQPQESQPVALQSIASPSQPASSPMPSAGRPVFSGQGSVFVVADESASAGDVERGLARLDPLTRRPRVSTTVLCVVCAVVIVALAFGVWWLGVCTMDGQSFDDMATMSYAKSMPGWLSSRMWPLSKSMVVFAVSGLMAVVAVLVAVMRKRWWLLGQMAAFAAAVLAVAHWLKPALPRPFIINVQTATHNSAPSGHVMIAAAASMLLLFAVGRAWRAACAVWGLLFTAGVGLSVVVDRWHRPTDVVMAVLLVGGMSLLMLAATRGSGMDAPGARMSSASVQIVGSVMITAGVLACAYAAYMVWQVLPGLSLSAQWALGGVVASATWAMLGVMALMFGLVLALRQLSAAPLTKLGLVGAPPAPPRG